MKLPTFSISQRGVVALLTVDMLLIIGAIAFSDGYRFPPLKTLTGENLLAFWIPLSGSLTLLKGFMDYLDSKVLENPDSAGDLSVLWTMPTFYVSMVAIASGFYQFFGGQALAADVQTMIVDGLLLVVNLLIRSFTNRAPTVTISKAQYKVTMTSGYIAPSA